MAEMTPTAMMYEGQRNTTTMKSTTTTTMKSRRKMPTTLTWNDDADD